MKSILKRISSAIADSPAIVALVIVAVAATLAAIAPPLSAREHPMNKPTVVLVHGAFAESSSWNGVSAKLLEKGYPVVAVANPLRGVKSDATYVANVLASISGPVILVGHSYGGSVISNVPTAKTNVKALVYVAGFAPDAGDTAATLSAKFPGGTLGPTLAPPVTLADGNRDLYIRQDKFHHQFAADVSAAGAKLMAVTQRPITEAALNEPGGEPTWKAIPSWFLYGSLDRNIPAEAHAFMAKRANSKTTIEVKDASHVVMTTHPEQLVMLVEQAAAHASN